MPTAETTERPRVTLGFPWISGKEYARQTDRVGHLPKHGWACVVRLFGHDYDSRGGWHAAAFVNPINPEDSVDLGRASSDAYDPRWEVTIGASGSGQKFADLNDAISFAEEALVRDITARRARVAAELESWNQLLDDLGVQP